MIEVKVNGAISNEMLTTLTESEGEKFLERQISEGMSEQMMSNIEDMAYIEMKQNSQGTAIEWEANMIVCSKDQIVSSVKIMAQRLSERLGASAEDIQYCLEPAVTDIKGF